MVRIMRANATLKTLPKGSESGKSPSVSIWSLTAGSAASSQVGLSRTKHRRSWERGQSRRYACSMFSQSASRWLEPLPDTAGSVASCVHHHEAAIHGQGLSSQAILKYRFPLPSTGDALDRPLRILPSSFHAIPRTCRCLASSVNIYIAFCGPDPFEDSHSLKTPRSPRLRVKKDQSIPKAATC